MIKNIHDIKQSLWDKIGIKFDNSMIESFIDSDDVEQSLYNLYIHNFTNAINIISGSKIKNNDILKHKTAKILVLSIIKNCASSFSKIKTFIEDLQSKTEQTCFYYYTNNNLDRTVSLLTDWSKTNTKVSGKNINDEEIHTILHNKKIGNRIHKFAEYRQQCLLEAINHFGNDFDYLIVFDSDLYSDIPVNNLLMSMNLEEDWSVISGNMTYNNSGYHYDQLALRLFNDDIDITKIYPHFNKFYGFSPKWLHKLYIFNDVVEVRSAFGGLSIYKFNEILDAMNHHHNLYDLSNYPEGTCEHISLSDKLPNKKFISSLISYSTKNSLERIVVDPTKVFIPRDAGFFSVFNFYIGSLTRGLRLYPIFNKEIFMKLHKTNAHFSYWTEQFNCWFDYFDPVSFYDNDNTHLNIDTIDKVYQYKITVGEIAPKEFTHPATSELIMHDKHNFPIWRKYVHSIYSQYVKFNQNILDEVNNYWNNHITQNNVIGVHYRHPSHSCESGNVYLSQYFDKIDTLLETNPNTDIFLASDNMFGILAFKDRYGNKIKYIEDINRLDMDNFLAWSYELAKGKKADVVGMINGKGFELQHIAASNNTGSKKMTTDLFKEVLCLSKCNYLIHTVSNIPLAISYMNPNIEMIMIQGVK